MRLSLIQSVFVATLLASSLLTAQPVASMSAVEYRQLGIRYRDQGLLPEAVSALRKAVALDSSNRTGRVNLGWTLHLAGRDREAAEVLQETILLDPFHVQTFNALGIVYLVNDDLASAALTHTWATVLEPDNEIAHYNLSLAYERLAEYEWASAAARRAAALEPENPHVWVALAIAYQGQGADKQAQQAYQQAIKRDSRYSESNFLDHLQEAGFSSSQITASEQILEAVR
ncbi:tetratricopeptide repeat protein [Phormidium tenue FACHB-886]|nr:tetratricopeptide repeat protein [Phormidium tenue FACHB-886]